MTIASSGLGGCGYQLAGGSRDPLGPFTVTGGEIRTAYAEIAAAAEDGARGELARQGAIGGGNGSTIFVEVLRVDETGDAISAVGGGAGAVPVSQAVRITVVGDAWVRHDGMTTRATGDVRIVEIAARAGDAAHGVLVHDEAARRAARRLGVTLVRRVLGYPEPGDP